MADIKNVCAVYFVCANGSLSHRPFLSLDWRHYQMANGF
jgi:hypothetical protein